MGLFDFLKKKKSMGDTTSEPAYNESCQHKTFYNKQGNSTTDYSTANFLQMLSHSPHRVPTSPDEFPRYTSYIFEIHNPIQRFKDLIKEGYLRKSSIPEVLNTLKVVDLKKILFDNGIDTKVRKKSDLIAQIQSNIDLDKILLPEMYSVSDKAITFMDQNKDLLKLAQNPYNITYEEYISARQGQEYLSYNDTIWSVFNRREMFSGGNYHIRRQNTYNMARFLKTENRYTESIRHYIHTLFYDLNDQLRVMPDWVKEDWDGSVEQIQSDIIDNIFEMKSFYLPQMAEECYRLIEPSELLVERDGFTKIINDIFESKEIDVRNYLPEGCR